MCKRQLHIRWSTAGWRSVAGVAALWAEATGRRGYELWATLTQAAQRLTEPSVDVGSGLVLVCDNVSDGGALLAGLVAEHCARSGRAGRRSSRSWAG